MRQRPSRPPASRSSRSARGASRGSAGGRTDPKRPVVAVVPFGARVANRASESDAKRPGAWARQIARRLVDRLGGEPAVEVRPVFLVAVPQHDTQAGYLVFGSTPDAAQAADYGRRLGATHTLTGLYREETAGRYLEASLVFVDGMREAARFTLEIGAGELHRVEPALATWLVGSVGRRASVNTTDPALASETAYAALLEAMDFEMDATLLRSGDPAGADAAVSAAAARYVDVLRNEPGAEWVEDKLLVLAAASLERQDPARLLPALDDLVTVRSRSWRAHYILAELRREAGETSGAIVALEHADSLHPLRGEDVLMLARLYVMSGANAAAEARLRSLIRSSGDRAIVANARRLRFRLRHPELERALEEAGRLAVEGDPARAAEADEAFAKVLAVEPDIWEAHFGRGMLARQRGDTRAAAASFERARELNPASAELIAELERSEQDLAN